MTSMATRRVLIIFAPAALLLATVAVGGSLAVSAWLQQPTLLLDAGPVVDIGLPIAKSLVNIASALTIGALVLAVFALPTEKAGYSTAMDIAAGGACAWAALSFGTSVLAYFSLAGPVPFDIFPASFGQFLTEVSLGQGWLTTTIAAAFLAVFCFAVRAPALVATALVAAFATLIPIALQGHAAGAGSHSAASTALWLHAGGAATWIGGLLVAAVLMSRTDHGPAGMLLRRYSTIALICFVVVAASGTISAALRFDQPDQLWSTGYGQILLIKIVALLALGVAGAAHRRYLIGRFDSSAGARRIIAWLIVSETLLMGVASGAAVVLARTAPPVGEDLAVTPSQILTGQSLPAPLSLGRFFDSWTIDPIWAIGAGFALVLYLAGVRRLRHRGDPWPILRTVSWIVGLAVLVYVTNGAPAVYGTYLFSQHMLEHMTLSMMVPIFLVLGAPVTLALRAIHPRKDGSRGPREWIMAITRSRVTAAITHPLVVAVLFVGSTLVFYYSPLFGWSLADPIGHQWMIAHFLIVGYLFALSMIGTDPIPYRLPYPMRLVTLLVVMASHAFFGLSIITSTELFLPDWYGVITQGWAVDPLADQQAAGGVAWSIGEIPTLVLAITMVTLWSRSDARETKRIDRNADRTGDRDLNEYNAMLRAMSERKTPK
ncbi:cytochrome c oxidase assembly protein [Herbiconiux sp. A18JL235]|uniref:Cytochrome c oxidase assembly protein n=1 Tax=Herbiconiux sp. A18JL235 TaxID=3152363 RepID=A0AB39BMW5_9MICO